jgi:hypothetical protein
LVEQSRRTACDGTALLDGRVLAEIPAEGFEYHILAIAAALAIMIKGSGALEIPILVA